MSRRGHLSAKERLEKLEELKRLKAEYRLLGYVPYAKQLEFHHLRARERALFGASRAGKTLSAGMETAMHLSGIYPHWWQGLRFKKAVRWGVGSETGDLLKKGPQRILFGPMEAIGTGTIPKALLVLPPRMSRGVPDGIDVLQVRHCTEGQADGTLSAAVFMSYADGRAKWASDEWDGAWLDEEPDLDIYTEAVTRTNTSMGPVMLTFTPLRGISEVVMRFRNSQPDTAWCGLGLEEALHFSAKDRERIIASYPEHEREARVRGEPMLGEGKIFKTPESVIAIDGFVVPKHFAVIAGMDFGIDHPFAAVKLAWDKDTDTIYVMQTYRERGLTPVAHASALRHWGNVRWAWPHDGLIRDRQSAEQIAQFYRNEGLDLTSEHAQYPDERKNGLEASIVDLDQRMQSGRFKVFSHLHEWLDEYRYYHRKIVMAENGARRSVPVKERDDLISATRYATMMLHYAEVETPLPQLDRYRAAYAKQQRRSWMGA